MTTSKHWVWIAGLIFSGSTFAAAEFATMKEAEALVAKAVTAIKANTQKTYDEITAKDAKWVDRDLYPVVYDMTGKVLAHGQNAKQVGKDLIDMMDPDGKPFVKERIDLAKSKGKFTQDYKFTDPVSKKILPKQMYCEKLDETVVCAGVYKH
jgi:signal transduction histidine kinase